MRPLFERQRPRRRGSKPGSQSWRGDLDDPVRPCVGQTLADDALETFGGALAVVEAILRPRVVAELELGKVAVQMVLGAMLIHAAHTALEDGERTLNGVRVDGAVVEIDIVESGMDGRAMLAELATNLAVHLGFVGHQARFAADVVENDRVNVGSGAVLDMEPAALAALTVNESDNSALVSGAATGSNAALEADVRLVNFDRATARTERGGKIAGAHGFADTVGEEPSALVLDFQNAAKLVSADALLARYDQVNGLEHLGQGKAGVFEHGANLDGELLAALATLLEAVTNLTLGVLAAGLRLDARQVVHAATGHTTVRAHHSASPHDALKVLVSLGFVMEVRGRKYRHG